MKKIKFRCKGCNNTLKFECEKNHRAFEGDDYALLIEIHPCESCSKIEGSLKRSLNNAIEKALKEHEGGGVS